MEIVEFGKLGILEYRLKLLTKYQRFLNWMEDIDVIVAFDEVFGNGLSVAVEVMIGNHLSFDCFLKFVDFRLEGGDEESFGRVFFGGFSPMMCEISES